MLAIFILCRADVLNGLLSEITDLNAIGPVSPEEITDLLSPQTSQLSPDFRQHQQPQCVPFSAPQSHQPPSSCSGVSCATTARNPYLTPPLSHMSPSTARSDCLYTSGHHSPLPMSNSPPHLQLTPPSPMTSRCSQASGECCDVTSVLSA